MKENFKSKVHIQLSTFFLANISCTNIISYVLDLTTNNEQIVLMFHYLAWQEYGVKKNSLTLFDIIHSLKYMSSNCTLVHCNDGVGRTGVFIGLFHLIHEIHCQAKHLNVFQTVINLRKDRKFMVRELDLHI